MAHLLDNPHIWRFFRLLINILFSTDKYKQQLLNDLGGGINLPDYSILDLGCGIGNFSQIFKGEYFGIDMNDKYIKYASKHFAGERKEFICADVATYAFETNKKFDLVCLFDFAHHLPDDSLLNILSTVKQISKRYILIVDPARDKNNSILIKLINKFDRGKYIRTNMHLTELIKKVELKIIENPFGNIYLCSPIERPNGRFS